MLLVCLKIKVSSESYMEIKIFLFLNIFRILQEESRAFVRSLPPIEYEPTQNWIHITYYELSKRVL